MREVREFYDEFETCRAQDIPLCADACPFKLDILEVQERVLKKRFNAAYKTIRDSLCFPGIVAEICPGYCEGQCIRKAFDAPVQIRMLEKSINALASRREPNSYNLPKRPNKVAVVGAGLSGMAFALKMASRKYQVSVFEKSSQIGGSLKDILSEDIYMEEFQLQFKNESYNLELNREIRDLKELEDFDVIYVATGKDGNHFDQLPSGLNVEGAIEEISHSQDEDFNVEIHWPDGKKSGLFFGGELLGRDHIYALAEGINTAALADNYIKTGVIEEMDDLFGGTQSKCVADEDRITVADATESKKDVYDEDEIITEASRCIRCQCNGCESYCDLVNFYGKWPVKMRDEIFLSVKPAGSLVHKSPARKYIAACTDCRIMEESACPEHIELCSMIKSARHQMHAVDKMPLAYKQYYTRDMEFANGEYAAVVKKGTNNFAFFPGCNLGALNPDYVIKPYKWLLEKFPGTGLLLKCCSIPIDWAGNTEDHIKAIEELRQNWEMMGKPTLITACLSCDRHLKENLPEIETITLYEFIARRAELLDAFAGGNLGDENPVYSIFDPCSAHGRDEVIDSVRSIAKAVNLSFGELPKKDKHGCCGFGGQGEVAQPEFTDHVVKRRMELSENPYLVYCSNCRDIFQGRGKKAVHILDLLFDIDPDGRMKLPSLTTRRENRTTLKERLLQEIWGESMDNKPQGSIYRLKMSEEVAAKVEKQRLLAEDISRVIERAESTGRRTRNPENNHYKAYDEIGAITLWVEYGYGDDASSNEREIFNVFSHRMQIKLEAVFNGKKIDG